MTGDDDNPLEDEELLEASMQRTGRLDGCYLIIVVLLLWCLYHHYLG